MSQNSPASESESLWSSLTDRFGDVLQGTSTEVYFVDAATLRFLGANTAACHNLGYSLDEFRELTVADVSPDAYRAGLEQRLARLRPGESPEVLSETAHRRKDGTTYPVALHLLRSEHASGDIYIGLANNISARQAAERELRESRERLDLAVRGSGVTVWSCDLTLGESLFDAQLATLLGIPIAEPLDNSERAQWMHADDVQRVREVWSQNLKGLSENYECEFRVRAADGSWRWLRAAGSVVERETDGTAIRAAGTLLDVTDRRESAAALAAYEAELRAVFESSADVIMMLAPDGEILRVNRGALRSELPAGPYAVGRNLFEYIPDPCPSRPTGHRDLRRAIADALDGHSTTIEGGGATPFGNEWFELTFSPVRSADPARPIVAAFLRDVTARREAETSRLREQRVLTEIASAAAAARSPRALLRSLRAPLSEIVPRPWIDFGYVQGDSIVYPASAHEPIVTPRDDGVNDALTDGQSNWHGWDEPLSPGAEILHAAGVRASSLTASYVGGEPVGLLLAASRDPEFRLGEQTLRLLKVIAGIVGPPMANLRAVEEIERQRALYNTALSSLSEAVILLDETGEAVFFNEEGARIVDALSASPGEVTDDEVPVVPNDVAVDFAAAIGDRVPRSGRRVPVGVSGETRWYDYEFIPLAFDPPRTLAIAKDVSAEVEREAADERHRDEMSKAARLSALGSLIGGVAHELNNPLTAILGFAEIIEGDGAAYVDEIGVIRKEALRARDIVRDLLFIARPGPVEFVDVSMADVVRHVERLRRASWGQQGIATEVSLPGATVFVRGNAHHLTQVLLNLVTNAEDALAGVPSARLRIAASIEGDSVCLAVTDNGPGMSVETAARAFEPFFTTKSGKGTGLGLSVIQNIVTTHGGTIDMRSKPGEGTRVLVRLPLWSGQPADFAPPPDRVDSRRPLRVLVVDDEPALRSVARRLVESLGHECVTAATVADAVTALHSTHFDRVVCDYRLGTETATDLVCQLIREGDAGFLNQFVIATGATTDEGVTELTARYGLSLLPKPYGRQQLAAWLESDVDARL